MSYRQRSYLIFAAAAAWLLLATCGGCAGGPYLQAKFNRGNSAKGENNSKEVTVSRENQTYAKEIPEQGFLTLKSGNYRIVFEAASAWTLDELHFEGRQFGLNNGHYGTVLTPKGGKWWGTGHSEGGREVVHSLKLTVDGEEHPVTTGKTAEGKKVTLLKHSTIWKFKAEVTVSLTPDYIFEMTRLEALDDCELDVLYYFMHCFPPTTTRWLAQTSEGDFEEGKLSATGKMVLNRDTRWVAQYDPRSSLSLLCYTPAVIRGTKSCSMIWDLDRYHKYYLRQNRGQSFKKGDKLDYTVVVKALPEKPDGWHATRAAAASLAEEISAAKNN